MAAAKGVWFVDGALGFAASALCFVLSSKPFLVLFAPIFGLQMAASPSIDAWKLALAGLFAVVGARAAWHYYGVLSNITRQSEDALSTWLPTQQRASRWYWLLSLTGIIFSGALMWGLV